MDSKMLPMLAPPQFFVNRKPIVNFDYKQLTQLIGKRLTKLISQPSSES